MVHWQYVNAGYTSDRKHLDTAEEYAQKIMALDPGGPHGPALLGLTSTQRGDIIGWVRHLESAVAVEPNDSDYLLWLAVGWGFAGFPERAAPLFEQLLSNDPLFDLAHMGHSMNEYFCGRFTQMNKIATEARRLSPSNSGWPLLIVHSLAATGDFEKAATTAEKLAPDPHSHPVITLTHVLKHALRGEAEAADKLASKDFVDAIWGDGHYTHIMSQAQALLGRKEQGLRWLEQSAEGCFINYPFLKDRAPLLDNLRAEPEFARVMDGVRKKWEGFKAELGVE